MSLEDLQTVPTQQEILDGELIPELKVRGSRVTDWLVGGVYRAMSFAVSKLTRMGRLLIASLASGEFEDYAFGFVPGPNGIDVTDWAPVIAKQRYRLTQIAATYTRRTITLTNATATPYNGVQPGDVIIQFTSGNRYLLDEVVNIPAAGSVQATFRSEFTTDSANGLQYTDPSNSTIRMVVSSYAGVTATNPSTTYSDVTQSGSGVGLVVPSGSPTGNHSVVVRIDAGGTVAGSTVAWSTSVDGAAYVAQSGSSASNLGGVTGLDVSLDDNAGDPAFAVGAKYYYSTPGSDITEVGRDKETPQELGTRCRGLIPLLGVLKDAAGNFVPMSPTESGYALLAKTASDQVKIAFVALDTVVPNKVLIYVSGQGALLPGDALAAVQNLLDSRHMITDRPEVLSPALRTINLANMTITVRRGQLATAQAAVQRAYQLYFAGVDAAQLGINGLVEHSWLVALARNATGVITVDDEALTINGVANDLQLPVTVGAYELASWQEQVATVFAWNEQ